MWSLTSEGRIRQPLQLDNKQLDNKQIIIIIITDLYSAFKSEDTEALDAAQED